MKNILLVLLEKSKEELIDEILKLRAENEKLRQTLETKEKEESWKKFLKWMRASQRKKHPAAPGQKVGHEGLMRTKPETIDRTIEQTLKRCPDYHHPLSKSQKVARHLQERKLGDKTQNGYDRTRNGYNRTNGTSVNRLIWKSATGGLAASLHPCG